MKNNHTFACSVVVLFILSTGLSALATAQDKTAASSLENWVLMSVLTKVMKVRV